MTINNGPFDTTDNMTAAMEVISNSSNVPAELKDEFEIFSMFEENNKFDNLSGKTIKPIVVWFNEESFKNSETGEIDDDIKTYIFCEEDGEYKIYSGFSVTMRIKLQLLNNVFKNELPTIQVNKVSKGMKQEYSIKPIKNVSAKK